MSRCRFRRRSDSEILCWRIDDGRGIHDGFLGSGQEARKRGGGGLACGFMLMPSFGTAARLATVGSGNGIKGAESGGCQDRPGSLKVGR